MITRKSIHAQRLYTILLDRQTIVGKSDVSSVNLFAIQTQSLSRSIGDSTYQCLGLSCGTDNWLTRFAHPPLIFTRVIKSETCSQFLISPPPLDALWFRGAKNRKSIKQQEASSYDMTPCPPQIWYRSVQRKLGILSAICPSPENGPRYFLNHHQ